ncbi:molybdopterin oxidoreductase family protein, partial [Vibrio parahaemolyticus V-223/04]
CKTQIFV